ncbi:hypothetical protein ACWCOT_07125 [Nonomuraea bangladeshensis]
MTRRLTPAAFAKLLRRHRGGPLRLQDARVTGDLDLSRRTLEFDLQFEGCTIEGALELTGLSGHTVDLTGARMRAVRAAQIRLTGDLILANSVLGGDVNGSWPLPDLTAEETDAVRVPQRVHASGSVVLELSGARIDRDLVLRGARLAAVDQWPMFAGQLQVGGSFVGTDLTCGGALYLRSASIGTAIYADGARIGGLDLTAAHVGGGVYADWGFHSVGQVRLRGITAGGVVTFHQADVHGLHLAGLRAPRLRLDLGARPSGRIVLRDAQVGSYIDSPTSWPEPGRLDLSGFSYERLAEGDTLDVRRRLRWLALDINAGAGAFEQLARFYSRVGDERAARLTRQARQRHLRRKDRLAARLWGVLQDVLFGYGYAPGRALLWLLVLVTSGAVWFSARPPRPIRHDGPTWDAVLYTLDLIVPVANLGQRNAWDPVGVDKAVAAALILAGWLLATAVIAGVGRVLNRG